MAIGYAKLNQWNGFWDFRVFLPGIGKSWFS